MKQYAFYVYSCIMALVISLAFGLGIHSRSADFNRTVQKALSASVNYDQTFISMVDRLEKELAERASFGYEGGKDPMTGQVRKVVERPQVAQQPAIADTSGKKPDSAKTPQPDPFRLTAIIYDNDAKNYTAVVMENERTFSVNIGDKVGSRIIKGITMDALVMEEDSLLYRYDVSGKTSIKKK
jgi:hypothetical protein